MKNLLESSEIFEASSRLQAAASALRKISQGEKLTEYDQYNLQWCGQFLEEVDWGAQDHPVGDIGHLAVQATEVRPAFYVTLLNTQKVFEEGGIQDPKELRNFLSAMYLFLVSGGKTNENQFLEKIDLGATFHERLATELLMRLTGNGVPMEKNRPAFALA
jgi:hypothetical protein